MQFVWIVVSCPVFLFMITSSTSALEWSLESLFYPMTYIGNKIENTFSKSLSRHKRADTTPQEYIVDIEVTVVNSSILNDLRTFAKELKLPITITINGTSLDITGLDVTAVCNINKSTVNCACESGYVWPSDVCLSTPTCAGSSTTCDCLTAYPSQGCELYQPPGSITTRNMSMRILKQYDQNMANPSSFEYQYLKKQLNDSFLVAYSSLPGFQYANVTGFRNGSIVVDYIIVAGQVTDNNITAANSKVTDYLGARNLTVDPNGFKRFIYDKTLFTALPVTVFKGDDVNLICKTTSSSTTITWSHNGTNIAMDRPKYLSSSTVIDGTSVSTMTISQLALSDGGRYTCSLDDGLYTYVQSQDIEVKLLTVETNANIVCGAGVVDIFKCCTDGNNGNLAATCTAGAQGFSGVMRNDIPCVVYSVKADVSKCQFGNTTASYNCECYTGSGANERKTIPVTFTRTGTIAIQPPVKNVSSTKTFKLTCTTDATVPGTIKWVLGSSGDVDGKYYQITGTTSILEATANMDWSGTIYCVFTQNNDTIKIKASATINVFDLPIQSSITTDPIKKNVYCNNTFNPVVPLQCCYKGDGVYQVTFGTLETGLVKRDGSCYSTKYTKSTCSKGTVAINCTFSNELKDGGVSSKEDIQLVYTTDQVKCANDDALGQGTAGATAVKKCQLENNSTVGTISYNCTDGGWHATNRNCISSAINDRQLQLEVLLQNPNVQQQIPGYLANLSSTVVEIKENVSSSLSDIVAILNILQSVSDTVIIVKEQSMKDVINVVSIIVENPAAWESQSPADTTTTSSRLLSAVETFAKKLEIVNNSINFESKSRNIILQGINITAENEIYNKKFNFTNATGDVQIPAGLLPIDTTVVTIGYDSLVNILPRDNETREVNSLVLSTVLNRNISKNDFQILMTFPKINISLVNATCVYWNFSQANGTGGWDITGCKVYDNGSVVICTCDHSTPFSILMSSNSGSSHNFTKEQRDILNYITYFGVGISVGSLVICIIIEALVWKSVTKNKTSYMRHVCIVNIAVSLLIADIWFLIGARMSDILEEAAKNNTITNAGDACVAATFFTQFFYLSVFFWMLTMGLILFYRMVFVFHDMSKTTMMVICFCLGYGCPLIISVITVAVTQPSNNYREGMTCWLNMKPTMAFLAFVVPALIIVAANFIILIVVIVKLLRPSVGDKPKKEEKSMLVKIAKSVAILTPLLGLTWGFGIGTLSSDKVVIHGIFSALNSLQGLFILLFTTLWDTKVREALLHRLSLPRWASQQSKTTKTTTLSSSRTGGSRPDIKPNLKMPSFNVFGKKGKYGISSAFRSTTLETDSALYSTLD